MPSRQPLAAVMETNHTNPNLIGTLQAMTNLPALYKTLLGRVMFNLATSLRTPLLWRTGSMDSHEKHRSMTSAGSICGRFPTRARPSDFSRRQFAQLVVDAYQVNARSVERWAVFQEAHPSSVSVTEQRVHFHLIVETDKATRWLELARHLREQHKIFASVSTSSSRQSYWAAFAYLYTPTAKKPKEDLDPDFVLSPQHEDPPLKLVQKREGDRRLRPLEVFNTIVTHELDSVLKFQAFAARQMAAGDPSWVQHCMRQGEKRLRESIATAQGVKSAEARLHRSGMSHMEVLGSALGASCICSGHAIPG